LIVSTALQGELDYRNAPFSDRLLLVREDGTIVGHRGFVQDPIGANMLQLLDMKWEEAQCFRAVLDAPVDAFSLLYVGSTSVPVLRALFGATYLQLVLLPSGRVAAELAAPALLAPYLERCTLSEEARAHAQPLTEQGANAVRNWLLPYRRAFLHSHVRENTPRETASGLARLIRDLAALCGCHVRYDLLGLAAITPDRVDFAFVQGVLLALFLAARRVAKDGLVSLSIAESRAWGDALYATLELRDPARDCVLPELEPITEAVRQSGALFSYYTQPDAPARVHVCAQLLRAELQKQQMKVGYPMQGAVREKRAYPTPAATDYPEITARAARDLSRMRENGEIPE